MTENGAGLSRRAAETDESLIRYMFEQANALAGDRDLVRLEVGEPDFDTPSHVVVAAHDAATAGETHYTSNAGIPPLRDAIAAKMRRENDLDVAAENVVVTTGAMEALYLGLMAVVDPGDEIVVPTPTYTNYLAMATMLDAEVVEVPLSPESGFALDADAVAEAITDDTAAAVLNTPCNPTGQVFDAEPLARVVATADAHDAYVVADEVYEGLIYEGSPRGTAAVSDHPESVITVNSCSKKYAMTGWRLGWLVAPPEIVDATRRLHQGTTSCASSISQHAALAALTGPQEPFEEMKASFAERREYVVDRVADLPGVACPTLEGAFYAFLDVRHLDESSLDLAERILHEAGVVLAPGSAFADAGEGYLRLSFASDLENLEAGFDRLEPWFRNVH